MPQHRVFGTRSNKESFRRRRKALFGSSENILQDGAQVFVLVRQCNSYYVYNSDSSQGWLPAMGSKVQPLYRQRQDFGDNGNANAYFDGIDIFNPKMSNSEPSTVEDNLSTINNTHVHEAGNTITVQSTADFIEPQGYPREIEFELECNETSNVICPDNGSIGFPHARQPWQSSPGKTHTDKYSQATFVNSARLTPPVLRTSSSYPGNKIKRRRNMEGGR